MQPLENIKQSNMYSEKEIKQRLFEQKETGIFPDDWAFRVKNILEKKAEILVSGKTYTATHGYIKTYFTKSKFHIVSSHINAAVIDMLNEAELENRLKMASINKMSATNKQIEQLSLEIRHLLYNLKELKPNSLNKALEKANDLVSWIKEEIK